jgi:hypothetical protein
LDVCAASAAECQQKAKGAKSEEDRQSWLAMADSWQETAKLREILERQPPFIHKS